MPQSNDQYDPALDDATAVPAGWGPAPTIPTALSADCACPADCPRDHENE